MNNRTLTFYWKNNPSFFFIVVISAIVNSSLVFTAASLLQQLVNLSIETGAISAINKLFHMIIEVALLGLLDVSLRYAKKVLCASSNIKIMSSVFDHIIYTVDEEVKKSTADYYSAIDSDLKVTASFYQNLDNVLNQLAVSCGSILFIFTLSLRIGLLLTGLGSIIIIYNNFIGPKFAELQKDILSDNSAIKKITLQAYASYVDSHFYDFGILEQKYSKAYDKYIASNLFRARLNIITSVFGYLIGFLQTYLPLLLVPIFLSKFQLGDILALVSNIPTFMVIFRAIGSLFIAVSESMVGAERIISLLDSSFVGQSEKPAVPINENLEMNICCNNLVVDRAGTTVFSVEHLEIPLSHNIGIWGNKGTGKSTFVKMLCGLINKYKGSISWNGVEFSGISVAESAKFIAYLPQEFPVFCLSLRENFAIAAPEKTERDYWKYLEMVNLEKEVAMMVHGLDTVVDNETISTGQRQRLAICMALLRDTPIIILDEPISNLDTDNIGIIRNLIRTMRDRIFIIVSHDRSVFLEDFAILHFENGSFWLETG